MFRWLSQRLGKSKRKTRQLSEREIYISPMFKRLSQRFGKSQKKTEQLQPREFSDDSVEQESAPQQVSSASLLSLLKTTIADAEQIAGSIKMRAQKEAEAEAARIIAQAQLEVQKIKGRAEIDAQKLAEDIISAANRKAEITEVEAKHKALQFLIGMGEEIEKEVREEYKRAYSRLFSSLLDLMNEAQNIEAELRGKRVQLWESKTFELKQYEAGLLSTYKAAVAPSETSAPTKTGVELDVVSQEGKVDEPVQLQEEPLEEKVEEPVQLQEEALEGKVEEPTQLQEKAIVSEPVGEATEELLEQHLPEEKPGREEDELAPLELDSQAPYAGEVEVEIATPIDPKMVYKLYDHLQTIPELKILHTRGSWDRGTVIAVVLEKPMPLVSLLSEMAGVEVTQALPQKGSLVEGISGSLLGTKRKGTKRIKLTLKEPAP